MQPLISIIVPVYNVERYLARCLDSLLNQTYRNLEIWLIDDGSKDRSSRICDEYQARDSRIRVIHKENGGVSSARNLGLDRYTGDFLMFQDADDYLCEDAIETLYKRMICDQSDMVIGRTVHVDETGKILLDAYSSMTDEVMTAQEAWERLGTKRDLPCYSGAKLHKKSVLEDVRYPLMPISEDVWIFPEIIDHCQKISTVSKAIYYYVQQPNSAVHTIDDEKRKMVMQGAIRMTRFMLEKNLKANACSYYTYTVSQAVKMGNIRSARKLLRDSFSAWERANLQKKDIHSLLRWGGLYIPAIRQMLQRRESNRK